VDRKPDLPGGIGWTMEHLQRKLLAVVAADVVAYTGLMETAEEATHARLMQLLSTVIRPGIAAHNGLIVKHTGDGFLAAFDSAVDATECALLIQENVARAAGEPNVPPILLRIGINLADAIIEPHDIFGDGVNLAVRLQASAEPGGIVVSATVAEQLRARGPIDLVDLGVLALKHLSRPVRAFAVPTRANIPAVSILPGALPDDRPSIAVLPFRVQPIGADDAWFAEGVIEGVIHVLSGIENLFVIGRGTSLAYAGRDVDPRAVGRDLGVRYVLSGSVRRLDNRLRIATELVDATSGSVIRSDRLDGAVTDLFDMQDLIARHVVSAIAPAVHDRELARALRKHPDSMTGYDLLLQALDLLYRLKQEEFDRARGLLQQAMASDPGFAPAYSHTATWHMFRIGQGWSPNFGEDAREAARCAIAALERDRNDAVGLAIHGQMLSFTRRDYDGALHFLDRAIAAGPSCHMAWTLSSTTSGWIGDGKRAVEHAERALQLSPLDPFAFFTEHMLSQGHYISGNYEEAVIWGRRAAARNGRLTSNLRTLAATLVALGDLAGAREIGRRVLEIEPEFSLQKFAARSPIKPGILERHIPRLRSAGLPD
jgi:TolB-like protein/class 3 adenylate cyclase/tetratricopeptide (TPR) repeat protein